MKNTLTTKEVAKLLRVSDATVKRWAESGMLKSERTKGGHRRFRVEDVAKFQAENCLGQKRYQGDENPLKLARFKPRLKVEESSFLGSLLSSSEEEAGSILIKAYLFGDSLPKIFDEIICPALRRIGELWFEGKINVAQEHLATRVVHNALHRLRSSMPVVEQRSEIAFCCGFEGDFHELPTYLSQMIFESYGWEVKNFGANMPLYSLTDEVLRYSPDLVCISVTFMEDYERLARDYADFRSKISRLKIPVALGGKIFEDERVCNRFPAEFYLQNFMQLSKLIESLSLEHSSTFCNEESVSK